MKKTKILFYIAMALLLAINVSCNKVENKSQSGSLLVVKSLTGNSLEGKSGSTTAFCDVLKGHTVVNDNGELEIMARLINPDNNQPSYYQDVIIDRIEVCYHRVDLKRPRQGKDIPYSFTQEMNVLVKQGETKKVGFILVSHNAKMESPLVDLVPLGQEHVLKLEAEVIVYSRDTAGYRLAPVRGFISVSCSNFADKEKK